MTKISKQFIPSQTCLHLHHHTTFSLLDHHSHNNSSNKIHLTTLNKLLKLSHRTTNPPSNRPLFKPLYALLMAAYLRLRSKASVAFVGWKRATNKVMVIFFNPRLPTVFLKTTQKAITTQIMSFLVFTAVNIMALLIVTIRKGLLKNLTVIGQQ